MSVIAFPTTNTAQRPAIARPRLRITRRGRLVLGALLAGPVAIALALSALAGAPAQAGSVPAGSSFEYISVAAGESLWDVAGWIAPDADPREVVAALVDLNQLPSADVQPGQRLAIPADYAG